MPADLETDKHDVLGAPAANADHSESGHAASAETRPDSPSPARNALEPSGQELIDRYKSNYEMDTAAAVTEAMILEHWQLEKDLRRELLDSHPDDRWATFERAYDTLYTKLAWLNALQYSGSTWKADSYVLWQELIGQPPQHVYEVGSGRGQIITQLAKQGFECKATEITQERGKKWASDIPTLTWGASDGIHLDRFEMPATYDVVISNQVIEHMHPDDVPEHFRSTCHILKESGRYIFSTPHRFHGPFDVTRVFGHDEPMGTHLKEYTHRDLRHIALNAGFRRVSAVFRLPRSLRRATRVGPVCSRTYLRYLMLVESILSLLPPRRRRQTARFSKWFLFSSNIMMVAEK